MLLLLLRMPIGGSRYYCCSTYGKVQGRIEGRVPAAIQDTRKHRQNQTDDDFGSRGDGHADCADSFYAVRFIIAPNAVLNTDETSNSNTARPATLASIQYGTSERRDDEEVLFERSILATYYLVLPIS